MSKAYHNKLYKATKPKKEAKAKVAPRKSDLEFTPFIVANYESIEKCKGWLNDMKNGWRPEPSAFRLKTVEQVYNQLVYNTNYFIFIANNWERLVELSVPVTEDDGKGREIVDLDNPLYYWHEPNLAKMYAGQYNNEMFTNYGKWRDIMQLCACWIVGGTQEQIDVLITAYRIVAKQYVYHHGFASFDDDFGVVFKENWREKMSSIYKGKLYISK